MVIARLAVAVDRQDIRRHLLVFIERGFAMRRVRLSICCR